MTPRVKVLPDRTCTTLRKHEEPGAEEPLAGPPASPPRSLVAARAALCFIFADAWLAPRHPSGMAFLMSFHNPPGARRSFYNFDAASSWLSIQAMRRSIQLFSQRTSSWNEWPT